MVFLHNLLVSVFVCDIVSLFDRLLYFLKLFVELMQKHEKINLFDTKKKLSLKMHKVMQIAIHVLKLPKHFWVHKKTRI